MGLPIQLNSIWEAYENLKKWNETTIEVRYFEVVEYNSHVGGNAKFSNCGERQSRKMKGFFSFPIAFSVNILDSDKDIIVIEDFIKSI